MGLVGNGIRLNGNPGRYTGGLNRGDVVTWLRHRSSVLPFYYGEATVIGGASIADKNGWPGGSTHPHSWVMPIKAGAMASRNIIRGSGTLTADLYQGVALASDLSGTCTITAGLDLVTALAADLAGTCTVTAGLDSTTALAADLSGSGTITAGLALIVDMIAALTGTCTITAGLSGTLELSADLTVTASQDFPTADENAAAVMASLIEAGYTLRDVVALLAARDLGNSSGGPTNPAYLGLDGVTVRVTGATTSDGNRSGIVLTPG